MEIKCTIKSVAPTREGLRLWMTVEHSKAKWTRISSTVLVLSELNYVERRAVADWLEDARDEMEALDRKEWTPETLY